MRRNPGKRAWPCLAALLIAIGALVALPPPSAHAELNHPRQQFLRDSTGGLFLHWGMRTSPGYTSCGAWESAVTNGGWNPGYWVDETRKLHGQYLVLATFHSRLGYARPWPSAIPGSCHTNRDLLGELITAASAKGLKVILYMTDDPQWHAEGLPAGSSWLNSSAYSQYKGHSVDLTTRDGFGEFGYDNFVEVMQRYPSLGGFWIDNDNGYWEQHGLYERIRSERPDFTLSNNNEDTPIMDMISNEQKTGMTPNYDYPQAVYTAAPRLIEADFKLPSSGAWWYTGTDSTVDYKLTLGRLITCAGSSVKALMAETPMVNGRMPANQEAFNNFANGYLNTIWESIGGTEGGGYLRGGLKPGFWNDGAHGVTTISKTNPDLHYVHVVTRPSGSTLRLRDNGYRVTRVSDLRTGAAVAFSQGGGNLTITGVSTWDQYDTVFKVETAGREGIYPPSSYTMSASASASGHGAPAAADGDYLTYWDSNKTTPVSLRFDLGSAKRVQYIGINQREDSVSYARSGTEQSARIRDYRVYVSADGTNWGTPVKTGTLPSHRGVAFVDIPATTTRHVRLEVVNTHAASTDTTRYQRLRVDEAWIGSDYAGTTAPSSRYEAENATISQGLVESNHTGYTGTGFVNYDNLTGSYVEFTVNAAAAGTATLTFRYANGTTTNRPMDITVNGTLAADELAFIGTSTWDMWQTKSVQVTLNAGANKIRATATTTNGGPNVDHLVVAP
ncbi:alpha-L-fucosidase [Lentzea sp. NBRC 105346]|uniref:discoidin domain-containing protein n=1 Tax=Lentzea sp. NBRC 105346 TaxID=3032205 RepID=UPI0024A0013F|nr:discoidin domain-containing protein [Lentzea sp. NBRC 105346]GLZ29341.1 alpha-L-fucosidase [Lentzea sp. NBRC 105346]